MTPSMHRDPNVQQREIPAGFVKQKYQLLRRDATIESPARLRDGKVSEAALVKLCLEEPERFQSVMKQAAVKIGTYPRLPALVVASGNRAKNLEKSLNALKNIGAQIGWPEMRKGGASLSTVNFLVLMRHGPPRDTLAAADSFAKILVTNPRHMRDALGSPALGNQRSRIVKAIQSFKPMSGVDVAGSAGPRKGVNPLLPRNTSEPEVSR